MVHRGQGLRLALESRQSFGIGCDVGGQDLEGDVTAQLLILGTVDLTHASLAEQGGDLVMG